MRTTLCSLALAAGLSVFAGCSSDGDSDSRSSRDYEFTTSLLGEEGKGFYLATHGLEKARAHTAARAIGLAHYELGLCYRQVGDTAIVRDHITQAASALHAAGDRRHLAMVHSLTGILQAQDGRLDEAMADDLSVVNGARVSFARHKTEMDDSDAGLIRFLMRDRRVSKQESVTRMDLIVNWTATLRKR